MFFGKPISCPPRPAVAIHQPTITFPIQPNISEPTNKLSVKVNQNSIVFYNSQNGRDELRVKLHRTLRIPDDGKIYPLPPSLGTFPIKKVDDYLHKVPEHWRQKGGVFVCLHQREAMWMQFENSLNPHALKVAVGKVNALSGEQWDEEIKARTIQDYCVTPTQKWLDGINSGNGTIKQFIAMPLGQGYTVESQVTGEDKVGGAQIICYNPFQEKVQQWSNPIIQNKIPSKKKKQEYFISPPTVCASSNMQSFLNYAPPSQSYTMQPMQQECMSSPMSSTSSFSSQSSIVSMKMCKPSISQARSRCVSDSFNESEKCMRRESSMGQELGLAAGGKMKQDISKDTHGPSFWDERTKCRVFIHIVNSEMYQQITGEKAPPCPISAKTYSSYNYPWFDHYNENLPSIGESSILSNVKSVKQVDIQKYGYSPQDNQSVKINNVITTKTVWNPNDVRDGDW